MRAGFIGVVGLPNAGKSTLVNALVGEKVSIVSEKPQTTRRRVNGILTTKDYQMIFVDAPGFTKSSSGLNSFLKAELDDVVTQSDVLILALNVDEESPEFVDRFVQTAQKSLKPWIVAITKTDLGMSHRAQYIRTRLALESVPVFEVSALSNPKGARALIVAALEKVLPESEKPLFDEEIYTTETLREMSAEIIRERCFELLFQEIPYSLAIRISEFKEHEDRATRIGAEIIVEKENHKLIVIGKGGSKIREIGTQSRLAIEELVGRKVMLDLRVVVKPQWMNHRPLMEELGYVRV